MPFMDGLQLCRVLRDSLPKTKIIILSGHDEFKYAQAAIQIGVTEYLLKPLSAQDLLAALRKVARQLDRERQAAAQLEALQARMSDQQWLLRERCLLSLLTGALTPAEIAEQCRQLGIDLVAPWYLAMLVRADDHSPARYSAFQRVDSALAQALAGLPHVVWCKKDFEETALILRGGDPDQLRHESRQLAERLRQQIAALADCAVSIGIGQPTARIGLIVQSFMQAVEDAAAAPLAGAGQPRAAASAEIIKPNAAALDQLLKSGARTDIERFFSAYLAPLDAANYHSRVIVDYVVTDALLTSANFLRELGARPEAILPELNRIEAAIERLRSFDDIRRLVCSALERALDYRDRQTHHQRPLVDRARAYIDTHYADPDISLSSVAAHVMLSPSYFSVVFGREVGETFIEYLTGARIRKAMELLRTTSLPSSDIACRVGYHNPRYFYAVFRKVTGQSPIEFRRQA
jgi:two-component system response regulator YesN